MLEPRERMRTPAPVKETTSIGVMGENLASYLNTLKATNEKQFSAIGKALHLLIPSISDIRVEINRVGEVELKILEADREIPASVVSEGTLRIIGLLALNSSRILPSLVGFEEPENGIHPRRIRLVADMLSDMSRSCNTSLIVTSHSPTFMDVLPDSALFAVSKEHGRTSISPLQTTVGELSREKDIAAGLDAEDESPISQRLMRGDFDAA